MNEFNILKLKEYINLENRFLERNELLKNKSFKKKSFDELNNNIKILEKNIEKYFNKPIIFNFISRKRKRLKKINLPKKNYVKTNIKQKN